MAPPPPDDDLKPDSTPPLADGAATQYGAVPPAPVDPEATRYGEQATPAADPLATNYTPTDPNATRYGPSDPFAGRRHGFQPCRFGEYELLEEIAHGGMGVVYQARHRSSGRVVALKRIRPDRLSSTETVARFEREARAAAGLDHPGIVPVYDIGEAEGLHYFTMLYLPGGSLQGVLTQGPLPVHTVAWLVRQVAEAVQHAHDHRVLHRDIKPHNILLQSSNATTPAGPSSLHSILRQASSHEASLLPVPRLADFGLASLAEEDGPTISGNVLGTPAYMAPEQARGQRKRLGPATDVYGLGAVLYSLLTGRPPFQSSSPLETLRLVERTEPVSPRQLNPAVPADLETVCLRCLAKEPERRYGTARELAEELKRFLSGEPVRARPVDVLERGRRWCRRNPLVAGLMAAVVLVLLLGSGVSAWFAFLASGEANRAFKALAEQQKANETKEEAIARQKEETAKALKQFHTAVYVRRLDGVRERWRNFDIVGARELLRDCKSELRGWEWKHLNHLCRTRPWTFHGHTASVNSVVFSPDGKRLASTSDDKTVKLWDAQTGQETLTLEGHTLPVNSVVFHPEGKCLAAASEDGMILVWDVQTGQETLTLKGHTGGVTSVAYSPDGKHIVSASEDRTLKLWDADKGTELLSCKGHGDRVTSVAYSPEGKQIASASTDRTVRLWDAQTGQETLTLKGHANWVTCVVFSFDGKRLASASGDQGVKVWDAQTGRETLTLKGHTDIITSVVFSPDGKRLASASRDNTIKLWDVQTGQEVLTFKWHTNWVTSVAFSPDGKRLASASLDKTVKAWDPQIGQETLTLKGHTNSVTSVVFSPDGKRIASASDEKTVKLWDSRQVIPTPRVKAPQ